MFKQSNSYLHLNKTDDFSTYVTDSIVGVDEINLKFDVFKFQHYIDHTIGS